MKKFTLSTLSFLFLFSLVLNPINSVSWNDTGHRITAAIAWDYLTPTAKKNIISILKQAPKDSDILEMYNKNEEMAEKYFFMNVAYWPDVVRDRDKANRYQKYHKGNWHYIGSYWRQTDDGPVKADGLVEDENVVERIETFRKSLADPKTSNQEKAIQIAWVLHLIGDIHNPLHNTSRVTAETPDGDLGGNSFKLGDNWPWNLHSFWDGIIDLSAPKPDDVSEFDYYMSEVQKITMEHPKEDYIEFIKDQNAVNWNEEGKYITMTEVYPQDLKQNELPSKEYQERAYELAQQAMAISGYRMAEFLNDIFDK